MHGQLHFLRVIELLGSVEVVESGEFHGLVVASGRKKVSVRAPSQAVDGSLLNYRDISKVQNICLLLKPVKHTL